MQSKQNFARMAEAARQDGSQRGVDLDAAERAAADLLVALGIDLDREERRATPGRMARAYAELLAARPFRLTTVPNDEGYDELVLARAIPFRTLCEHHMLLFSGVAHVGYLPGERILGPRSPAIGQPQVCGVLFCPGFPVRHF